MKKAIIICSLFNLKIIMCKINNIEELDDFKILSEL